MHSFETICRQQLDSSRLVENLTRTWHSKLQRSVVEFLAQTSAIFESKEVLSSLFLSLESVSGASNADFRHCMWSSRSYRQILWDEGKARNILNHINVGQGNALFTSMWVGCVASKRVSYNKMQARDCPIPSSSRCLRSLISVVSESISISVSVTASPARDNFLEILRWMSDLAIRSVTFSSNDSLAPSGSSPLCFWRPTTSLFRFCSFRFSELTWLDLHHHGAFLLGSMCPACQLTIKKHTIQQTMM